MAKMVYIASSGHSGSTLLDLVIGSLDGVFSTGECQFLPWLIHRGNVEGASLDLQNVCSCRKSFTDCSVWGEVIRSLEGELGCDLRKRPLKFKLGFARGQAYGSGPNVFERIIRTVYFRTFVGSHSAIVRQSIARLYRETIWNNWSVYRSVCKVTGSAFVTDSSKDIVRMLLLNSGQTQNCFLVVLLRNIYGVVASNIKLGVHPVVAARNWVRSNCRILESARKIISTNRVVVRYEDLCADPAAVRRHIAELIGVKATIGDVAVDTRNCHLVAGNPMRYSGRLHISEDRGWEKLLRRDTVREVARIGNSPQLAELLEAFSLKGVVAQHDLS
jgi:hypothetical protein